MDKITKLSQAIRLGATFHPQCFGNLTISLGGDTVATCVIGAAAEACGMNIKHDITDMLFAGLKMRFDLPQSMAHALLLRNDTKRWTREAIADWVEKEGY